MHYLRKTTNFILIILLAAVVIAKNFVFHEKILQLYRVNGERYRLNNAFEICLRTTSYPVWTVKMVANDVRPVDR